MNFKKILKNKKAVSSTIATVFLVGITIISAAVVYGIVSSLTTFNSKISQGGVVLTQDANVDGLIDTITVPLINNGMSDADIESAIAVQNGNSYLWYTMDREVGVGTLEELNFYAIGESQQILPFVPFHVVVTFENNIYESPAFVATIASKVPSEVIPLIGSVDDFVGYQVLVDRTADDDPYGSNNFPAETGYSPTLWFVLGQFEDNVKRPNINVDYINLCEHGNEMEYLPHLLDDREFTNGNIGLQSNHLVVPYNDSGEHPGVIAINKYANWDKLDTLNWGKYGIVYMWSYIYVTGAQPISIDLGANGASEYKVWLNGQYLFTGGGNRFNWFTASNLVLNPGLNLIMMKISGETNAHFAGQVLLYNSAQLANVYSVWPTINDL